MSPNVALIFNNSHAYPKPMGNQFLNIFDGLYESSDTFDDEIALAIKTDKGLVVLSACSHNGVLNILDSCVKLIGCNNVCAFIGGTHLVDGVFEEADDIAGITDVIKLAYPNMKLNTSHCTGKKAMDILAEKLKDKFAIFYNGKQFSF